MAQIDKRVNSKGEVTYRVRIRLKGYPLTTATFARKTEAKVWAQQTEANMRAGRHIKNTEGKNKTVADLISLYEENLLPKRGRDRKTVAGELIWWKDQIGHLFLVDVTPQIVAKYQDRLEKDPIKVKEDPKTPKPPKYRKPATISRYLGSLSICFSYAVKLGWVSDNPVIKVEKPRLKNERVRFLTAEESKNLLTACKDSDYKQLYAIVVLALSTGARKGEIMALRWKDIDLGQKVMRLEETKNGDRRSIPLSSLALSVILDLRKIRRIDSQLLFPREDGLKAFDFRKHWNKAVKTAKLTDFKFHDLRHTAASNLAMSGASLLEIAEILGHRQMKMVRRYAHLTQQHTANVLERMNERQFSFSS